MEGKSVILSVVLVSLVLAQLGVEATTICCPSTKARINYMYCIAVGEETKATCLTMTGCISQSSDTCESPYDNVTLKKTGDHTVSAYCKLGCASSVCGAIATLRTSVNPGEVVNEAVNKCTETCTLFCNKGSKGAIKTE